jgi:hypothetical protein
MNQTPHSDPLEKLFLIGVICFGIACEAQLILWLRGSYQAHKVTFDSIMLPLICPCPLVIVARLRILLKARAVVGEISGAALRLVMMWVYAATSVGYLAFEGVLKIIMQ